VDINAALFALTGLAVAFGGGWFAIHQARAGTDYMSSRGNARKRAEAHESMIDNLKGLGLVLSAPVLAGLIIGVLGPHLGGGAVAP
jgi:hypothetical protein